MNALADIYFRPVLSICHEKKYVCLRFAASFDSRAIFKSFDSKMKESVLKFPRIKKFAYICYLHGPIFICVYIEMNLIVRVIDFTKTLLLTHSVSLLTIG